ncbi:MAG: PaaI family thioesterase [Micropepsaceae bacterium]
MSDWLAALPERVHGLPVQRPAMTGIALPEGFTEAVPLVDPFEAYSFQSFRRTNADGSVTYALPTDARHDNSNGVIHGGLLMTFADSVLGYAAWTACPPNTWCVTVSQRLKLPARSEGGRSDRGDAGGDAGDTLDDLHPRGVSGARGAGFPGRVDLENHRRMSVTKRSHM